MMQRRGSFARRLTDALLAFVILASLFPVQHTTAAGTLEFAKDVVTSVTPDKLFVVHTIDFTLPITSQQITPSDYIQIKLVDYGRVTPAGSIDGGFGTPNFILDGGTVKITNLAILPGTSVQIRGITAQNPSPTGDRTVIIQITDDAAGLTVRNEARVTPSEGAGFAQVTATFKSPLSAIGLDGYTSPGTFTTLTEGGTVLGTTSADSAGHFVFPVNGMNPGLHSLRISGSDTADRTTSQVSLEVDLIGGSVTNVSGILLSPTLELSVSQFEPGTPMTVTGAAKPNSQINIFTESPLRSYSTTTNNIGDWSYTFSSAETQTYQPGEYRIYTNVQDSAGNQSVASNTLGFTVLPIPGGDNPAPACDISQGDLNCDGKTNLVDFSILLFHWQTDHKVADINSDGTVNLVDFSIMMFYFAR